MANGPNDQMRRAQHLVSELDAATEHLALGLNQVANPK
jgi:hypothetical protein